MTEQKIESLQDAMDYASSAGVALTKADWTRLQEIQAAATSAGYTEAPATNKLQKIVDGFNRHYPAFLKFLTGLAEVLITMSQTVIVAFGAPIVLVLLLVVEHSRVKLGIGLFETEATAASFAAWAMVILNTVLEFTIYHVEAKHGYTAERELRGSLRLYGSNVAYWLGIGKRWRAETLSPANRYKKLQRLVTFTILALATAGSMRDVIASQSGAWHEALIAIVTDSSLSDMSTWAGGLLFACAAVLSAQVVTAYLAIRSREIIDTMHKDSTEASAAERAAIQFVLAKVTNKTGSAEMSIRIDNQQSTTIDTHEVIAETFLAPALPGANGNGHRY